MTAPHPTPPPIDPHGQVIDDYAARAAQHARVRDDTAHVATRVGWARLIVFLAGAFAVTFTAVRVESAVAAWVVGLVASIAFVALVRRHRALVSRIRLHESLRRACDAGISRIRREWAALQPPIPVTYSKAHAFAADLHVAGETSLMQLLGPVSAGVGRATLSEWLLAETPPSVSTLVSRQGAIQELRPLTDWRERLGVYGAAVGNETPADRFLGWAESDGWLLTRPDLRWAARILGVITPLAIFAAIGQLVPVGLAIVFVTGNLLVSAGVRRLVNQTLANASTRGFNGRAYSEMFNHAHGATFAAARLRELQQAMGAGATAPALAQLARIFDCADVRLSPVGHFVVQTLTLWDVHVVDALERWQSRHGRLMRGRLRALGELEAHSAVATLAYENPTWVFPAFREDAIIAIEARSLAHPLLPADTRVANDVTVGPAGTFLLVTGSNMAGKSTLLRSIALNVVLAQSGAPVCADEFLLPRVRLRTSIHVQDALEEGLSLFMVELLRLKSIVDVARDGGDPPMLYVADEMLRGTNMQERRPAVAAVLRHLLRAGAIGAIATHDLELATEPELEAHARAVHLVERFKDSSTGPVMWFDYRLRPGIATSRNAVKLLEMVGLGDESR